MLPSATAGEGWLPSARSLTASNSNCGPLRMTKLLPALAYGYLLSGSNSSRRQGEVRLTNRRAKSSTERVKVYSSVSGPLRDGASSQLWITY